MQDLDKYVLNEIALGVEFKLTTDSLVLPEKGLTYDKDEISRIDIFGVYIPS